MSLAFLDLPAHPAHGLFSSGICGGPVGAALGVDIGEGCLPRRACSRKPDGSLPRDCLPSRFLKSLKDIYLHFFWWCHRSLRAARHVLIRETYHRGLQTWTLLLLVSAEDRPPRALWAPPPKCRSPGRGNILSAFNPLGEQRGNREPEPQVTGRVGSASLTAHTCLTLARGCCKGNSRWGWKAPGFSRPNHRLLCRRRTEGPLCLGVPPDGPSFWFCNFHCSQSPKANSQSLPQEVPPSSPTHATATDRINPGGDRSRDTGAINILGQRGGSAQAAPSPPPSSEPGTSGHCGAAGGSLRWEGRTSSVSQAWLPLPFPRPPDCPTWGFSRCSGYTSRNPSLRLPPPSPGIFKSLLPGTRRWGQSWRKADFSFEMDERCCLWLEGNDLNQILHFKIWL